MARRRLALELDATTSQLRGELRDEHGHARTFSGWLGLAAALEQTLGEGAPAAAPEVQAAPTLSQEEP
jgi:hypothetical protein